MEDHMRESSSPSKPWWRESSTLGDITAGLAAVLAIVLTTLDLFDLLEVGWFQENLTKLILLLVSLIVISDVIERRFLTVNLQRTLLREIRTIQPSDHLRRIEAAGITNFYASRDDYYRYRGAPQLLDYLSLATKSIRIAAYWMSHGIEMEGIAQSLAKMAKPPRNLDITIAIIDPTAPYIPALASFLNMSARELIFRAQLSLSKLWEARENLLPEERTRFKIKVYSSVPIASVIILDAEQPDGRLQLDFKAYKVPRHFSFAFELRNRGRYLFDLCRDAWTRLLDEAEDLDPQEHLVGFADSDHVAQE